MILSKKCMVFVRDKHNCVFGFDFPAITTKTMDDFFRTMLNGEADLMDGRQHTDETMPRDENCGAFIVEQLLLSARDIVIPVRQPLVGSPTELLCNSKVPQEGETKNRTQALILATIGYMMRFETYYFFVDFMNDIVTYGFNVGTSGIVRKQDKVSFLCTFRTSSFFHAVQTFSAYISNNAVDVNSPEARDYLTQLLH